MKGKVKFFNEGKGFGFISADDGKEYFMHITGFSEGLRTLRDDDSVTFDVAEGDRGPKAVNIALDDGSAEDAPVVEEAVAEEEPVEEPVEEEVAEEVTEEAVAEEPTEEEVTEEVATEVAEDEEEEKKE